MDANPTFPPPHYPYSKDRHIRYKLALNVFIKVMCDLMATHSSPPPSPSAFLPSWKQNDSITSPSPLFTEGGGGVFSIYFFFNTIYYLETY